MNAFTAGGEFAIAEDITEHASQRMSARRLGLAAVEAALDYGRIVHVRSAAIHAIGRNEVEQFRPFGIDLSPHEGVQVVCGSDGAVVTVYRNSNFRSLKPSRHSGQYSRRKVQ